MKRIILGLLLIIALLVSSAAQDRLPKDYISPDEIITLSADLTFDQAFEILSKIAFDKAGKIIIDPAKRQGRIDVQIVNLPWKNAFEVILKAHRLSYKEHEHFFEVIGEAEQLQPDKASISLASREIRIKAVFFEGDRQALAEAGVDWSFLRSSAYASASFSVNGATGVSDEIVEGGAGYSKTVSGAEYSFEGMFRAFESQNLGRILAQPEIVVVSGREGRIQVGQDFSIKTRDFAGNIIDNFFSTGTILTVRPVVFSEGDIQFIHLQIEAERSSATPDVVSTTINKSEAKTEVILVDGECTSVGGLFSREYTTLRKGVPFLKDLPWWVLGLKYLFGQNLRSVSDKELMVVLKANLLPDLRARASAPKPDSSADTFERERKGYRSDFDKNWDQGIESQEK